LFAEYPEERKFVEKLKGEKTEQTADSLAGIWGMDAEASVAKANDLVKLGFFQVRGTRSEPTFWIPFLYRDGLKLVQGRAGGGGEETDVDCR
jgi:hypothetical protein